MLNSSPRKGCSWMAKGGQRCEFRHRKRRCDSHRKVCRRHFKRNSVRGARFNSVFITYSLQMPYQCQDEQERSRKKTKHGRAKPCLRLRIPDLHTGPAPTGKLHWWGFSFGRMPVETIPHPSPAAPSPSTWPFVFVALPVLESSGSEPATRDELPLTETGFIWQGMF